MIFTEALKIKGFRSSIYSHMARKYRCRTFNGSSSHQRRKRHSKAADPVFHRLGCEYGISLIRYNQVFVKYIDVDKLFFTKGRNTAQHFWESHCPRKFDLLVPRRICPESNRRSLFVAQKWHADKRFEWLKKTLLAKSKLNGCFEGKWEINER